MQTILDDNQTSLKSILNNQRARRKTWGDVLIEIRKDQQMAIKLIEKSGDIDVATSQQYEASQVSIKKLEVAIAAAEDALATYLAEVEQAAAAAKPRRRAK